MTNTVCLFLFTLLICKMAGASTTEDPITGSATNITSNTSYIATTAAPSNIHDLFACFGSVSHWSNITTAEKICFCQKRDPCVKDESPGFFAKSDFTKQKKYEDQNTIVLNVFTAGWVLGIVGNVLVIVAVSVYLRDDSATYVYLGGLAAANLVLIIFSFPLKVIEQLMPFWFLGQGLCLTLYFLKDFSFACPPFTLVLISVDRLHSLLTKQKRAHSFRRSCVTLAVVWFAAIIFASPNFYMMDLRERHHVFDTGQFQCGLRKTINKSGDWIIDPILLPIYFSVVFTIVFAIPLHVMFATYFGSFITLCCRNSGNDYQNGDSHDQGKKKQKCRMLCGLAVLSLVFCACWAPYMLYKLYTVHQEWSFEQVGHVIRITMYLEMLAYSNSVITPLLLMMMFRDFRRAMFAILQCRCFGSKTNLNSPADSSTRSDSTAASQ